MWISLFVYNLSIYLNLCTSLNKQCSEHYLELLIQSMQYLAPDSLQIDQMIREAMEEGRESFKKNVDKDTAAVAAAAAAASSSAAVSAGELFMFYWQMLMASLLLAFALSCISHFAQFHQMLLDQEASQKLRNRLPASVRQDITSPVSGRLILPPPSTKKKLTVQASSSPPHEMPRQHTKN